MNRLIFSIIITLGFFCLALLLIFGEAWFLENIWEVTPQPGITQQKWLQYFGSTAMLQSFVAVGFTLIWNIGGYLYYQIENWRKSGGRKLWSALLFVMLISISIISWQTVELTQDKSHFFAFLFYLINGVVIYWGASFLLSPSTIKYAPLYSKYSPLKRFI